MSKIINRHYHVVSTWQLMIMAFLVALISVALTHINTTVQQYIQLPTVVVGDDGKCLQVESLRNGEVYTCSDVNTILRNYRTTKK